MTTYPVLFGHRDLIAGKGFVAFVAADGRALLTQEEGGFWLFGVTPGGIAGGGAERSEAIREFKKSYLSVLFDIAAEVDSFDEFKRQAAEFFAEGNTPNEEIWNAALADVKRGELTIDLPRVRSETRPPQIEITQVRETDIGPNVNEFDELAEAA